MRKIKKTVQRCQNDLCKKVLSASMRFWRKVRSSRLHHLRTGISTIFNPGIADNKILLIARKSECRLKSLHTVSPKAGGRRRANRITALQAETQNPNKKAPTHHPT